MKRFRFGPLEAAFDSLSACGWRCQRCGLPVIQATMFVAETGSVLAFKKCGCGLCSHWTDEPGPRDARGWARVVAFMETRQVDLVMIWPASEGELRFGLN